MTDADPIIEAAARALMIADVHLTQANAERVAVVFTPIIEAAVTPLIRNVALEEAAKGWMLVPIKPTEKMLREAEKEWAAPGCRNVVARIWPALLAAAGKP